MFSFVESSRRYKTNLQTKTFYIGYEQSLTFTKIYLILGKRAAVALWSFTSL